MPTVILFFIAFSVHNGSACCQLDNTRIRLLAFLGSATQLPPLMLLLHHEKSPSVCSRIEPMTQYRKEQGPCSFCSKNSTVNTIVSTKGPYFIFENKAYRRLKDIKAS